MGAGKGRQRRPAVRGAGETHRVGLDPGGVGGQIRGDVREQHPGLVQAVGEVGQVRVEGRLRVDHPVGGPQQVGGARCAVADGGVGHQHGVGAAGGLHQCLGVFQPA